MKWDFENQNHLLKTYICKYKKFFKFKECENFHTDVGGFEPPIPTKVCRFSRPIL